MIKVLQVLPGLNMGGLETFVMNVYRLIDREKVQFDFLTNMAKGDYSEEIVSLGGKIFYIPSRNNGIVSFCKNLKSFFKKHRGEYDAIHYHESSLTSLEVLFFAKKAGIPVRIIHSHSSSIMGNKLHYLTHFLGKFFVSSLANRYFGCSDKALDWMFKHTGVRGDAVLIQNGINTERFSYSLSLRETTRYKLGISKDELVIGHIGRLTTVKNHVFLIDIFKCLQQLKKDSKLIIIGVGELENSLKDKVNNLNLNEKVIFLGSRSDTDALYQAMDIFVMPSLYEGLPVVLVEAQASGLPILCSDTISLMSKLTSTYYTLSVKESPMNWAEKIISITSGYNRIDGYENIRVKGFDIKDVAERLLIVYQNNQ